MSLQLSTLPTNDGPVRCTTGEPWPAFVPGLDVELPTHKSKPIASGGSFTLGSGHTASVNRRAWCVGSICKHRKDSELSGYVAFCVGL